MASKSNFPNLLYIQQGMHVPECSISKNLERTLSFYYFFSISTHLSVHASYCTFLTQAEVRRNIQSNINVCLCVFMYFDAHWLIYLGLIQNLCISVHCLSICNTVSLCVLIHVFLCVSSPILSPANAHLWFSKRLFF